MILGGGGGNDITNDRIKKKELNSLKEIYKKWKELGKIIPIEERYKDVEIRREYGSNGKLIREFIIQDGERLLIPIADGDYYHELRDRKTVTNRPELYTDNEGWTEG